MAVASYEKGTTFRFYKEDGTHYTAVQIKDNKLLEVKNPEGGEKRVYETLAEWLEAIGAKQDELKISTRDAAAAAKKAKEPKEQKQHFGKTSNGFIIPKDKRANLNKWIRWLYKIMKEAAPELLTSEEVKVAYNNLVGICLKDSDIESEYYLTGKMNYSIDLLSYYPGSARNAWSGIDGFKVFFQSERYGRDPGAIRSDYYGQNNLVKKERSVYEAARTEIATAYKALFELVYKPIHAHINKINNKKSLERNIALTKKRIANAEKVIARITARYVQSLNYDRTALERYEKELADLD